MAQKSIDTRVTTMERKIADITDMLSLVKGGFETTSSALEKGSGQMDALIHTTRGAIEAFSNLEKRQNAAEKRLSEVAQAQARHTETLHTIVKTLERIEKQLANRGE